VVRGRIIDPTISKNVVAYVANKTAFLGCTGQKSNTKQIAD
jgi:hypothetical protein